MNTKQIDLNQLNKILISIFLVSLFLYLGKVFLIPVAIAVFFCHAAVSGQPQATGLWFKKFASRINFNFALTGYPGSFRCGGLPENYGPAKRFAGIRSKSSRKDPSAAICAICTFE